MQYKVHLGKKAKNNTHQHPKETPLPPPLLTLAIFEKHCVAGFCDFWLLTLFSVTQRLLLVMSGVKLLVCLKVIFEGRKMEDFTCCSVAGCKNQIWSFPKLMGRGNKQLTDLLSVFGKLVILL